MRKRVSVLMSSVAAVAALCTAGAAHAADVAWSVGIGLPGVGAVISNGPSYPAVYAASYRQRYVDAPVYGGDYEPAPVPVYVQPRVVYRPAPVVYRQAPVAYRPAPVAYAPVPVAYAPVPIVAYEGPAYRERARPVPHRVWAPPARHHHGHGHGHHHDHRD